MNTMARPARWPIYLCSLAALLLSAVPLPHWLDLLRPDFLLLVIIWFAVMMPRSGGLLFAWICGLALDSFRGQILGENALAFVAVAYLAHRFHLRMRMFPNTTLKGRANLYVMPNLDAANITYNMVRVMTDGVAIGPILMGLDQPAHILTPASTPRRVVNMTAIAAVEAQIRKAQRDPAS